MGHWQRGTIVGLILLAVPAQAAADKQIEAGSSNRYTTPAVTMDQGERLTFVNNDVNNHDVLAEKTGADGMPLFRSELIGFGKSSFVEGSQYLTTGSYGFVCSIHSFMTGTLTVTSAGTPVPRPGQTPPPTPQPGDTTAPAVKLRPKATTLAAARRARRLAVSVTLDEAASVSLRASARLGGRTLTLGTRSINLSAGTKTVSVKLTAAAAKALRGRRSVRVTVRATAKDGSANKRTVSTARTLR